MYLAGLEGVTPLFLRPAPRCSFAEPRNTAALPIRLPGEAEWEYAARAGTATPFSIGPTITPEQANFDGSFTYGGGPTGTYRRRTVGVGSFAPNPFGLFDMHGNVWEWVEDCWAGTYRGAAADGTAQATSGCDHRVLRGGSWSSVPQHLRSANRSRNSPEARLTINGFRLARTLAP